MNFTSCFVIFLLITGEFPIELTRVYTNFPRQGIFVNALLILVSYYWTLEGEGKCDPSTSTTKINVFDTFQCETLISFNL